MSERKVMLKIAIPNKGRLSENCRSLLSRAGLSVDAPARALQANLGDGFGALFVRASDIPEFVADGTVELGITGRDLVAEVGRPLEIVTDLGFGRCRLCVAVRDESDIGSVADVPDGARVATVFPRIAENYFKTAGRPVTIVPLSGATEIAPHVGLADIIVDLVSTGSTLKVNGLREIATILESSAVLITRPDVLNGVDGSQARGLATALESVLRAQSKRYLMANVPRAALDEVRRIIPGISGPTIVEVLDGGEHVAAHAVVESSDIYRVIGELKAMGAGGILVTRIERLIP